VKKLAGLLLAIQVVYRAIEVKNREFVGPGVAQAAERGAELAEAPAPLGEHVAGVALVEDFGRELLQKPGVDFGHRGQVLRLAGAQPGALGLQALVLLLVVKQLLAFGPAVAGRKVGG